ncbi:MAG TPA: sigmaK-factor processing regulatory BofA [Methanocorpusculum sp.]|nr:sigmaK-factor processing regulatory BofA [Methanocorpusculum sp.]
MADIVATIVLIGLAVVACIVLFFILKNGVKLLINAVAGVIILLILTFFNIFPALGDITVAKVIVCALGGIVGVILLVVLSFFGITI